MWGFRNLNLRFYRFWDWCHVVDICFQYKYAEIYLRHINVQCTFYLLLLLLFKTRIDFLHFVHVLMIIVTGFCASLTIHCQVTTVTSHNLQSIILFVNTNPNLSEWTYRKVLPWKHVQTIPVYKRSNWFIDERPSKLKVYNCLRLTLLPKWNQPSEKSNRH